MIIFRQRWLFIEFHNNIRIQVFVIIVALHFIHIEEAPVRITREQLCEIRATLRLKLVNIVVKFFIHKILRTLNLTLTPRFSTRKLMGEIGLVTKCFVHMA